MIENKEMFNKLCYIKNELMALGCMINKKHIKEIDYELEMLMDAIRHVEAIMEEDL